MSSAHRQSLRPGWLLRLAWATVASAHLSVFVGGCGDQPDSAQQPDGDTQLRFSMCPAQAAERFVVPNQAFENAAADEWRASHPYVTHSAQDVLGLGPEHVLRGVMSRSSGLLMQQSTVSGEWVSNWTLQGGTRWKMIGRMRTDESGAFALARPFDEPFAVGTATAFSVLEGDLTCSLHGIFIWPPGTQIVLTDMDGTLTVADNELIRQVLGDPDYVPIPTGHAVDMLRAWASKRYGVVYLSARPHNLRGISRWWLQDLGAPLGPLVTADALVVGEAARAYKAQSLREMIDALQWRIVAAYGNAETDIEAYEDAGLPKQQTFIIGPNAGRAGTVPVANDDFADHVERYVMAQPDAVQPF